MNMECKESKEWDIFYKFLKHMNPGQELKIPGNTTVVFFYHDDISIYINHF